MSDSPKIYALEHDTYYAGSSIALVKLLLRFATVRGKHGFNQRIYTYKDVKCFFDSALVGVTDAAGKNLFEGRTVTGFSDVEEELVGGLDAIPFLLETRIKELGGNFVKAEKPWGVSW